MRTLKIRVKDKEHSVAIQNRLVYIGYNWRSAPVGRWVDDPFLYTDSDGIITRGTSEAPFIAHHKYKEVTLDDLFDIKKEEPWIVETKTLNQENQVAFYRDHISVGCQKFTLKSIREFIGTFHRIYN